MARTFQNPANRHEESVGIGSSVGVFFLGLIYLAYKGLWAHVFIWLLVVVVPNFSGAPLFVFTLPLASIFYAMAIQQILAARYLSKGWREVTPLPPDEAQDLASSTAHILSMPDPMLPRQSAQAPAATADTKTCPYCAEEVKVAATRCKHCHSDLPAARIAQAHVNTGSPHIKYYDGMYMVGGYHFDKLEQAQQCLAEWVGPKP